MSEKSVASLGRRRFLKYCVAIIVVAIVLGVGGYVAWQAAQPPTKPITEEEKPFHWRIGTAAAGTAGYTLHQVSAKIVNKYVGEHVTAEVVPATRGLIETVYLLDRGEVDSAYISTTILKWAWKNEEIFKDNPVKVKPYQGYYSGSACFFVITRADRDDINCLKDLCGKRFFPAPAGSSIREIWRIVLTELGYWDKIEERQMDWMQAADALKMGSVDAVGGYTTSRFILPSWVKNIDAKVDIKVVLPSDDEKAKIEKIKGLGTVEFPVGEMFSQDVGVEKIWAWEDYYGFGLGPHIPEDAAYWFTKAQVEYVDEMAEMHPFFKTLLKDPFWATVKAIDSNPDIPVHPGVARYLKEVGVWKDYWKIGKIVTGS